MNAKEMMMWDLGAKNTKPMIPGTFTKDTCVVRKLKKETIDKDRLFRTQQDSCNYFECVPKESFHEFSRPLTKQNEKEQCSSFIYDLNSVLEK